MSEKVQPELVEVLEESRRIGHLGPGAVERHIAHAQGYVAVAEWSPTAHWCDLGSGGGVPGLVVALEVPSSTGLLLDARRLRCEFLQASARRLGLDERLEVWEGRAEQYRARGIFDVVTARAFARPAITAECAAPLLRPGGMLIVSDPPVGGDRWPSQITELGLEHRSVAHEAGHFSVLLRSGDIDDRFPRRFAAMSKRPLF